MVGSGRVSSIFLTWIHHGGWNRLEQQDAPTQFVVFLVVPSLKATGGSRRKESTQPFFSSKPKRRRSWPRNSWRFRLFLWGRTPLIYLWLVGLCWASLGGARVSPDPWVQLFLAALFFFLGGEALWWMDPGRFVHAWIRQGKGWDFWQERALILDNKKIWEWTRIVYQSFPSGDFFFYYMAPGRRRLLWSWVAEAQGMYPGWKDAAALSGRRISNRTQNAPTTTWCGHFVERFHK